MIDPWVEVVRMRGSCGSIAVAAVLASLVPFAAAQAQQGGVSNSRLMFDPAGLQGSTTRKDMAQPQASPTSGQSTAPQSLAPPAVKQTAAPQPPTRPAAKPAAAPKPPERATASAPARPAGVRRPAQADGAGNRTATGTARSSERPIPREQPPALGRLSLPEGSLGFESQTQMKAYDMDGRRVPGYDNIQRNDSSYFGLSLRMPTGSSPSTLREHGAN